MEQVKNISEKIEEAEEKLVMENIRSKRTSLRNDSRGAEERSPVTFGGGSRFNLPKGVINRLKENGKVGAFVTISAGHKEARENYWDAVERGWEPIKVSDFPELRRQSAISPFGDEREDDLYKKGGQIGMTRSKETDDAEKKHYDGETIRQNYMADLYNMTDSRHPRPFIDQREGGKFGRIRS